MSQHHVELQWQRESADFTYQSYNRDHRWVFDGGAEVPASFLKRCAFPKGAANSPPTRLPGEANTTSMGSRPRLPAIAATLLYKNGL